jgi:hypothetical protein
MRPKSPPNSAPKAPDSVSIALKRMHETVISEEVPSDFTELLAAIERKIAAGKGDR